MTLRAAHSATTEASLTGSAFAAARAVASIIIIRTPLTRRSG
jgi:hypothetical protein